MPTAAEQYATIKTAALAKIVEIQGRPDYANDGQERKYQNMVAELKKTVAWCDEMLQAENGPAEEITQAIVGDWPYGDLGCL